MAMASEPSHRLNKAGRLVFRQAGRKFYEAHSPSHAHFLASLHRHPQLEPLFPSLRGCHGVFVEAAWVAARPWPAASPAELADLLRQVQQASIAVLPSSGFDYWDDFLVPRFRKAAQLLGMEEHAQALLERCGAWLADQPMGLQHPDLTPANVLRVRGGALVVIDNELCCVGRSGLLDVCNALHPLSARARQRWLACFWPQGLPAPIREQLPDLAAAWTVRRVGSLLVSGRLAEARQWLERQQSGGVQLPFHPDWL